MNMTKEEIEERERLEAEAVEWVLGNPSVTKEGGEVVRLWGNPADHQKWVDDVKKRLEERPVATKESLVGIYLEFKARYRDGRNAPAGS